jgi:hypothetical protein
MSFRATKFVRQLRGLSAVEKAVAFVVADHDNHKGGGAHPSMATIAEESGIENRETASRIMARLVAYKVIQAPQPSRGRKPTVYFFNFEIANCDSPVTVADPRTVTRESQLPFPNRDSEPVENAPTVTLEGSNRDSPVTGRVLKGTTRKGKARGAPAEPSLSCFTGQHLSVTQRQDALLGEAFPWVDRQSEYRKIDSWLEANPERRPKKASRFLHNWFQRCRKEGASEPKSFHERRSEKTAQAITKVLGRFEEAPGSVQRTLPPTHK